MTAISPMSNRRAIAKGVLDSSGRAIVACRFDEALFDEIQTLAIAGNLSFAAQIRVLVGEALKARAVTQKVAA